MGYNHWNGRTGRSRWVETPEPELLPPPPPPPPPPRRPMPMRPVGLEEEDLLILAVLWLLYRSSGQQEMLIALAAYLLL